MLGSAHSLVSGFHSIAKKNKIALQRASKAYINQLQYSPKYIRFDVIEVSISEEGKEISNTTSMYYFFLNATRQNDELS